MFKRLFLGIVALVGVWFWVWMNLFGGWRGLDTALAEYRNLVELAALIYAVVAPMYGIIIWALEKGGSRLLLASYALGLLTAFVLHVWAGFGFSDDDLVFTMVWTALGLTPIAYYILEPFGIPYLKPTVAETMRRPPYDN